jgi:hypothetical protein
MLVKPIGLVLDKLLERSGERVHGALKRFSQAWKRETNIVVEPSPPAEEEKQQ